MPEPQQQAQGVEDFLVDYLESIHNLPSEVAFNMAVLRDLDEKFYNIVDSMKHNSRSYAAIMKQRRTSASVNGGPVVIGADQNARGALVGYRKDYANAVEQADRKVKVAQRMLEQFNNHYHRLEKTLEKFEEEEHRAGGSRKRKRTRSTEEMALSSSRRRRRTVSAEEKQDGAASEEEEDKTVYCICQQVSYGDMVACDNENCPIEWFHYACVGLNSPPKGSWYCTSCLAQGYGRSSPLPSAFPPTPSPTASHKRGSSSSLDEPIIDVEGDDEVKIEDEHVWEMTGEIKKEAGTASASGSRRPKKENG